MINKRKGKSDGWMICRLTTQSSSSTCTSVSSSLCLSVWPTGRVSPVLTGEGTRRGFLGAGIEAGSAPVSGELSVLGSWFLGSGAEDLSFFFLVLGLLGSKDQAALP